MSALLTNVAANTNGAQQSWPGGTGTFEGCGSFGGGTLSLQVLGADGTTWLPVGASTSLSAPGLAAFTLRPGQIRAVLSGATGPTGVYASAWRTRN